MHLYKTQMSEIFALQLLNYEHHDPLEKNKVISYTGIVLKIKSYSK